MSDKYSTIANPSQGLFKDKGSRFIAYAWSVSSEDQTAQLLKVLESEHHSARHICYAYRIVKPVQSADDSWSLESIWRANDNGEPSGSAGRPILGQIDSAGLSNVLVAVVRYFGGVLLGVPGLINAYRMAAAAALSNAEKVEKTVTRTVTIRFSYTDQPAVESALKVFGLQPASREYNEECVFTVEVPLDRKDAFLKMMP